MNTKLVFEQIVNGVESYLEYHNLKSMVLGISGGIDSTVISAACREVYRKTGKPFIGRSLPMKNSNDEINAANLVGKSFCSDFKEVALGSVRESFIDLYEKEDAYAELTKLADGNIQARLRMIYLYNLAGLTNGIVLDTDNFTEHLCGFWTKHGDEGDLKPIGTLFKTEVFELARYLVEKFREEKDELAAAAIEASLALKPTDGLGISDGDEEQLGAPYEEVDDIYINLMNSDITVNDSSQLKDLLPELVEKYGDKVAKLHDRHVRTQYKRVPTPVIPLHQLKDSDTKMQHGLSQMREREMQRRTQVIQEQSKELS